MNHFRGLTGIVAMLIFVSAVLMRAQTPAPEQKDVLIFTNGDQLSGTLERSAGGNVVFKSDMAGEITVPYAKIRELRTQGAFAVLRHGDPVSVSRRVQPGKIVLNATDVTVAESGGEATRVVPVKDVAYLVDAKTFNQDLVERASFFEGWNGAVNVGTTFVQSTTHGGTVTGGVALVRQVPVLTYFRPRNKTTLNFQENYGTLTTPAIPQAGLAADTVVTSIFHADAERDEYFRKNFYVLAVTAFDHNYAQSLGLQEIYGAGIGYTPFNTALHQMDVKAELHYEKQSFFTTTGNQNLVGSTFSESYRRTLPLKVTLAQTLALLPAWNNPHAYSGNAGVVVTAPLFRRLSMNLTTTDSYLNNPDPGYKKNSLNISTGFTYTLH